MITLETKFPLAVDSDDHIYPEGAFIDNNVNLRFIEGVERYYDGRKIDFMDLGCAGGGLVCEMHKRGHNSVGLEGSDTCLNPSRELVDKVQALPAGFGNWQTYGNNRLFTCDVTKRYQVYEDGQPLQFDLITCWDVMEHFYPDQIETFLRMVYNHMKPNGIFLASIALFDSGRHPHLVAADPNTPENLNYHKSVYGPEWWLERVNVFFNRIPFPFDQANRLSVPVEQNERYLTFVGVKKA